MVGDGEDIVVEVIVFLNHLADRQISVARVAVGVQLSLVNSPAVPVDFGIRVGYLVAYLRRSSPIPLRKSKERESRRRDKQAEQQRKGAFKHRHSSSKSFYFTITV